LAHENVGQTLLNILEVENNSITFHQHLMDQISSLADFERLVALGKITLPRVDVEVVFHVLCIYLVKNLLPLRQGVL
jgi:hypothetical protein